ncbi:MAG: F0F1 ATP synthase subunit A [Bacteroidia bacterium]|nr:F0F1 ATP synthase subunit A [Bacteroidia bacterium]
MRLKTFLLLVLIGLFAYTAFADQEPKKENAMKEMIMHHILDNYEYDIVQWGHTHVTLPLPRIIYSSETGLKIFLHTHDENKLKEMGLQLDAHRHGKLLTASGNPVLDLSITKNVFSMLIVMLLLTWIMTSVAKAYKRREGQAPKGLQSLIEPIIILVRDEIVKPNIGEKHYKKFLPYMLTVFFFIWLSNLIGMLPAGPNIMGNIATTSALASLTLILVLFFSKKDYWMHLLWMPGIPLALRPLMIIVELIGFISKPITLLIRLFANITAGHVMILALIGLIFMFGAKGGLLAGLGTSVVATAFVLFVDFLELLVGFLQAAVFTMLTCMYIGDAIAEHHHEEAHH